MFKLAWLPLLTAAVLASCQTYTEDRVAIALEYYEAAEEWVGLEDAGRATRLLQRSIELYPQFAEARFLLTRLYADEGDFDSALVQAEILLETGQGEGENRELLAYVFAASGSNDRARELYEELVDELPRAGIFLNLGLLYEADKNLSSAEESYRQALELDGANVRAASLLSRLLFERDQYQAIVLLLEPLSAELAGDRAAALRFAYSYQALELYPEFFALMEILLEEIPAGSTLEPHLSEIWNSLLLANARQLAATAMDDQRSLAAYRDLHNRGLLTTEQWELEQAELTAIPGLVETNAFITGIIEDIPNTEAEDPDE